MCNIALPATMSKLYHPAHVKAALRIEEALQWKGLALATLWKGKGSTSLISNSRELHIAPPDGKHFESGILHGMVGPLASIAGDNQYGAGLSGASCDIAHLHVTEALALPIKLNLSSTVVFLDLVTAFASMRRSIAVPGENGTDLEWQKHLQEAGFDAEEAQAITALACDVAAWNNAGAHEHTISLLTEAHAGTWFSVEGVSTICVFVKGALAGKPLVDLVFCAAMGRCLTILHAELLAAGILFTDASFTDGADALGGWIRCVVQSKARRRRGDLRIDNPGLDHGDALLRIELKDAIEPIQRDDDPIRDWQRTTREAGAAAASDKRQPQLMTKPYDADNFLRRLRHHHGERSGPESGETVAFVGRELHRAGEQTLRR